MASAILASRNEFSFAGSMGKTKTPHPNPKNKQRNELPAASDDAYSFNQKPTDSNPKTSFSHGEYVNFNISCYSRKEVNELRKRLAVELQQIRSLNNRIESGQLRLNSQSITKKLSGNKRPVKENGNDKWIKMCRQVLTKLMKHRHSWIFNKPVDASSMGLHDYHTIIKRPMDLGTVKSNITKNLYGSPSDFAADVRLTFNNAMLYNPKTDQVHVMADELLHLFDEMFKPIVDKFEGSAFIAEELQGSSWNEKPKKSKPSSIGPVVQNQSVAQVVQSPVRSPSPMRARAKKRLGGRGVTGKQPKPRAKDPNKREMSMEEKQKLGMGLQDLPQEKMPQLVQIIRKRNDHLAQEGDEIELDIEALDTETLWELDRFVMNWKKMVSKTRREALMGNNFNAAAPTTTTTTTAETDEVHLSERIDVMKRPKKGEGGEEDVEIGDEMPERSFPQVEIEKDGGGSAPGNGNASKSSGSSSSSSSDSSSSSGSDSGSSSGSDSDANEAQS